MTGKTSGRLSAVPRGQPPVAFPIGHYYSPMYDARELCAEPARSRIWPATPRTQPGINWNEEGQRRFLRDVCAGQDRLIFAVDEALDDATYYMHNEQYPPLDAWALEAVVRHARPRTIIEVGSGFSTLVTARVNREYLAGEAQFVAIEPHPRPFLTRGVDGLSELLIDRVENVGLDRFDALSAGDVVFIDTSHVVRTGNDVAWLYGQVLPRLAPGVYVHIHDVFLPGDYPEAWVADGWGWNESYLVEAFLQFNFAYDILLGIRWAVQNAMHELRGAFPGIREHGVGGSALWLHRNEGQR